MKGVIVNAISALAATMLFLLFLVKYMMNSIFSFLPLLFFGVVALILWITFNQTLTAYKGKKNTRRYAATGAVGKELVDSVAVAKNSDAVLENAEFAEKGLKLVVIGFSNRIKGPGYSWPLVVSKDCIYECEINAYSIPSEANVRFHCGPEKDNVRHQKMDVGKSAAVGYMVGGLGAAAYNAGKAAEVNAAGGIAYSYGTGKYPVSLSSGGLETEVRYFIIAHTVLDSLPESMNNEYLGDVVKKSPYFTLLRVDTYNRVSSDAIARSYMKILAMIANKMI